MIDKKGRSSLREENKNNWPKKIRKTRQQTKDAINGPTNNDNDTSIAKVGSVKVHAEQDKACDISDNTSISQHESEAGSGSVQKSNTRSRSPFHISSTSPHSQKSWVILLMNIHKPNRVIYDVSK